MRWVWLQMLKIILGLGLRFRLFPEQYRVLLGRIHSWIKLGELGRQALKFDRGMVIEVASICNASCSFCSYPILEFPRKIMPEKTFATALATARQAQIRELDFTPYLGEAFVDPQFIPRIRKSRQELAAVTMQITTNATLLTRFDLEAFLTSGINRINISFGAWGREDYLKLYNIDAWDKVRAGVEGLLAAKQKLKSSVYIALWYRVLDASQVKTNPENMALLERFKDVIDEIEYVDVFHDILAISGQQSEAIKVERQFDGAALKTRPCAHLGKLACSSVGQWFCCYCAASDCYKQEKSWFYLGSSDMTVAGLNGALAKKIEQWNSGQMSECCRTCPVYRPANEPAGTMIYPGPAPV